MAEEEKEKKHQYNGVTRPDLEGIAKNIATLQDDHMIDQIMPRVMHSFLEKTKKVDDNGHVTYKTKDFSEKEAHELADLVYDQLMNHSLEKQYGIKDKDQLKVLKGMKDKHGKSLADAVAFDHYNIRRHGLKKQFEMYKDDLNMDLLGQILKKPLEHHTNYHLREVTKDIDNRHVPYVKDFIQHFVKEKGMDNKIYDQVKDATSVEEVLQPYQQIAGTYFKDGGKK